MLPLVKSLYLSRVCIHCNVQKLYYMAPKQSTHPLARSLIGGSSRTSRQRTIPPGRQDEAVLIEDLSLRRKRTSSARSSLLIPSDLNRTESPSKRHRVGSGVPQAPSIAHDDGTPPAPAFDPTPIDFYQFALPPELDGIVIDHQVPEQRKRKVQPFK